MRGHFHTYVMWFPILLTAVSMPEFNQSGVVVVGPGSEAQARRIEPGGVGIDDQRVERVQGEAVAA